jgi:Ribosomal protein S16
MLKHRALAEKDGNKHLQLNMERAKYWLALGAQPSDSVARIFGQVQLLLCSFDKLAHAISPVAVKRAPLQASTNHTSHCDSTD